MTAVIYQEPATALRAADHALYAAATMAADKASAKPWLRFTLCIGGKAIDVVAVWPGVLHLFDAATGRPLAQSLPGKPFELAGWQTPTGWHAVTPEGGGKP